MLSAVRAVLVLALLSACATSGSDSAPTRGGLVVTSFEFDESALIGEIYAQALEAKGIAVRRQLRLGPRELVLPALRQGLADVAPEYVGSALTAVEQVPASELAGSGADELRRRLSAALSPDGLQVLEPAPARNVNALAVTRTTAERLGLTRTSDLSRTAATLAITGPPECPTRPLCLPGLRSAYGLSFREFIPYDTTRQRLAALEQGLADVAVVFSTDGGLADDDLVVLTDDRAMQPADHVVPVISERASSDPRLASTLNAVSRQLDSTDLILLNWRIGVGRGDLPAEARDWLLRHGLLPG